MCILSKTLVDNEVLLARQKTLSVYCDVRYFTTLNESFFFCEDVFGVINTNNSVITFTSSKQITSILSLVIITFVKV